MDKEKIVETKSSSEIWDDACAEARGIELPFWVVEEIFGLAQTHVMQMPTRNPQRRTRIAVAFEECRKAVAAANLSSQE